MSNIRIDCCICGKKDIGWGNNPDPITDKNGNPFPDNARCCDECNNKLVIPARLAEIYGDKESDND